MALDSTVLDLPDTPRNVRAFGRPASSARHECLWPRARVVALSECATHAICDAGVWRRHDSDERAVGRRLLRSVGPGTLLAWDRGFHSLEMVQAALARGSELLGRLPATVKPKVLDTLADGTRLVAPRPVAGRRRRHLLREEEERITVRLIRYTLDDPDRPGHGVEHRPITSLLDPASTLRPKSWMAHHSRWGFELAVDEIKSHQNACPRSRCVPRNRRASSRRSTGC